MSLFRCKASVRRHGGDRQFHVALWHGPLRPTFATCSGRLVWRLRRMVCTQRTLLRTSYGAPPMPHHPAESRTRLCVCAYRPFAHAHIGKRARKRTNAHANTWARPHAHVNRARVCMHTHAHTHARVRTGRVCAHTGTRTLSPVNTGARNMREALVCVQLDDLPPVPLPIARPASRIDASTHAHTVADTHARHTQTRATDSDGAVLARREG